ncbi:MAG: winged helix-turn-helix domain-containing protein, partial [Thaumarchaeota archaeon]|nr:winged helix-turn-helix domain-containing protein [Nitrososphaerota archaeon]
RNKTTFRILQELTKESLVSSKTLSEKTGLAKSTISEHVHHLLRENFVQIVLSSEGNFKVELLDREHFKDLLSSGLRLRNNDVVENFADLWDF